MLTSTFILAVLMPIMALSAPIPAHIPAILIRNSEMHLDRSIRDIFNDKPVILPEYAMAPKDDATLFGGVEESHDDAITHGKRSEAYHTRTSLHVVDMVGEEMDCALLLQRLFDSARSEGSHLLAMRLVIVLLSIAIVGELWNLWKLSRQLSIQNDETMYREWVSPPLSTIDEKGELV